ncbi:MAG: 16S rRNA (guanine(527)-N(7))-methyltransferase RsmG [Pseudomonadota bacterium]
MDDRFELEMVCGELGVDLSETAISNLLRYVAMLRKWQPAQNLVGPKTLEEIWTRHVADSLQLMSFLPPCGSGALAGDALGLHLMDLGSGAGLPGMVVALAAGENAHRVTLIEANGRKAAFLRAVSRETGVPVYVQQSRIEHVSHHQGPHVGIITARALAPLPKLASLAEPWMKTGATAFFHKGGEYSSELKSWPAASDYDVIEHPSVVDSTGRILQVRWKGPSSSRPNV